MKIALKQYAQTLYDLTEGKNKSDVEKSVADFARYLYKTGKLKLADNIIEQFGNIFNQKNGIVEVEVVSRKKMEGEETRKVKHFIKEKYSAKEVVLKNVVDEDVRGGMILRVGDEVMDGSVRGKLNMLKKVLAS